MTGPRSRTLLSPPGLGSLLAVAGTASMGLVFIFSKAALRTMDVAAFLPLWYGAGLFLAALYLAASRQIPRLRIPKRHWPLVALFGLLYSVGVFAFFWEIQLVDPNLVAFFGRLQTVYTVLWGVLFLKERLNRRDVAGMVLTLAGALIITFASGQNAWQAFFLALLGESLFTSLGFLVGKVILSRGVPPVALAAYRSLLICLLATTYALISGRWSAPSSQELLLIGMGAFFGPFLAWLLLMIALSRADASKVALVRNLQPVFVVGYSLVLFGTLPGPRQLVGGGIVILGIVLLLAGHR